VLLVDKKKRFQYLYATMEIRITENRKRGRRKILFFFFFFDTTEIILNINLNIFPYLNLITQ
jgi:hypothetical protein